MFASHAPEDVSNPCHHVGLAHRFRSRDLASSDDSSLGRFGSSQIRLPQFGQQASASSDGSSRTGSPQTPQQSGMPSGVLDEIVTGISFAMCEGVELLFQNRRLSLAVMTCGKVRLAPYTGQPPRVGRWEEDASSFDNINKSPQSTDCTAVSANRSLGSGPSANAVCSHVLHCVVLSLIHI